MTKYAADHAGALADVRTAGAAVTFTATTPGTHDAATGLFTSPTTLAVTGHAIRTKGVPERYRELGLIESEAPTLLVAPTTYGAVPAIGSVVTFGATTWTVRDVEPIAPDGTAILSRVVVVR